MSTHAIRPTYSGLSQIRWTDSSDEIKKAEDTRYSPKLVSRYNSLPGGFVQRIMLWSFPDTSLNVPDHRSKQLLVTVQWIVRGSLQWVACLARRKSPLSHQVPPLHPTGIFPESPHTYSEVSTPTSKSEMATGKWPLVAGLSTVE